MTHHLGCTGTQIGMTAAQLETVRGLLADAHRIGFSVLHHGDCIGADFEFATVAREIGFAVEDHPCTITSKRAFFAGDVVHDAKQPMARNDDIVAASSWVIATPSGTTEQFRGSGTWATIRRARKHCQGLIIVWPDGIYTTEPLWNAVVHSDNDMV